MVPLEEAPVGLAGKTEAVVEAGGDREVCAGGVGGDCAASAGGVGGDCAEYDRVDYVSAMEYENEHRTGLEYVSATEYGCAEHENELAGGTAAGAYLAPATTARKVQVQLRGRYHRPLGIAERRRERTSPA